MELGLFGFAAMTLTNAAICLALPKLLLLDWSQLGKSLRKEARPTVTNLTVTSENFPQA